jgi:hypothetical protein
MKENAFTVNYVATNELCASKTMITHFEQPNRSSMSLSLPSTVIDLFYCDSAFSEYSRRRGGRLSSVP